jgi:hypothetical protein
MVVFSNTIADSAVKTGARWSERIFTAVNSHMFCTRYVLVTQRKKIKPRIVGRDGVTISSMAVRDCPYTDRGAKVRWEKRRTVLGVAIRRV